MNFQREGRGEERTIVLRNQGDYLERAIHDVRFLYSRGRREREKEEEKKDSIKFLCRVSVNE